MKKALCCIFFALVILSALPLAVFADTGPKPSVTVAVENAAGTPCYGTLLSDRETCGPWRAYDGTGDQSDYYSSRGDIPEDVWLAMTAYRDSDGYYFMCRAWEISGNSGISWTYYPPKSFKILLYYPESDTFSVSGICERYAFDSYFTADDSEGTGRLAVKKSYEWGPEAVSLLARIIITIALELCVALLFGFRGRRELTLLAVVNVVTQILLNVALNLINFSQGQLAFVIWYFLLEIIVFLAEAVLYSVMMNRIAEKKRRVWFIVLYSLAANAVSFLAGFGLALIIPGIF